MGNRQATLEIELTKEQIIAAIRRMRRIERQEFVEDLLAATSPAYLHSIKEARADRRAGRVKSLDEVLS